MTDITDLHVRYLEQQLAQQQAVGQSLYKQGFTDGQRHSRLEIPEEFTSALRYGSAQEHVHMPLLDGRVTIVLARTGPGRADERREADAWEELERVRLDIRTQVSDGVRFVQRRQLPASIAAVIWQRQARCAVVTNTATPRPRLRAALRSQRAWIVALIIGWAIVRRAGRGALHTLAPTATVAAASAVAVTAIATTPPPTSISALQERGNPFRGQARPSPLGSPLAYDRPVRPRAQAPKETTAADPAAAETEVPAVPPVAAEPLPAPVDVRPAPDPSPAVPAPAPTPVEESPPPGDTPSDLPSTVQDDGDGTSTTPGPTATDGSVYPDPCLPGALPGAECE